jgi:hypothetical protein
MQELLETLAFALLVTSQVTAGIAAKEMTRSGIVALDRPRGR